MPLLILTAWALAVKTVAVIANVAQIASLFLGRHTKAATKHAASRARQQVRGASKKVRAHLSVHGQPHQHPARQFADTRNLGERAADVVASGMGSWPFIGVQTVFILIWIAGNIYLLSRPFDPPPFIALNLLFSVQAAYAAPILQLAGNRTASKDRARDDREAEEVELMVTLLKQNTTLTEQVAALTKAMHDHLTAPQDAPIPIAHVRKSRTPKEPV